MEAPLLPDLAAVVDEETREPVWAFKGEERVSVASAGGDGTVLAGLWEARARHGERETVYRFWASGGGGGGRGGKGGGAAAAEAAASAASASAPASAPPPLVLRPIRLHQQGPDMLSGSHFDEYVVNYGELVPGPPPAASFEKPRSCVGVEVDEGDKAWGPSRGGRLSRSARLAATAASVAPRLPCSSSGSRSSKWRRAPPPPSLVSSSSSSSSPSSSSSSSSASAPPSALEENAAFVAAHNSGARDGLLLSSLSSSSSSSSPSSSSSSSPPPPPPSYRVELNRFAALSDAEFASTYLQSESLAARRQRRKTKEEENGDGEGEEGRGEGGNKGKLQSSKNKKKKPFSAELPYSRKVPRDRVPSAVDWRGTGAVPQAVKDQSTCGSCWAFGTAAALEGASFLASGRAVSASEQQFMDCSWDFGANAACGGGDADAALDWLVKERRGEFEAEGSYQYIGAAGFCQKPPQEAQRRQRGGGGDGDDDNSSSSFNAYSPSASSPATKTRVAGYAFVPAGDDEALREAVYSRGPLQVSIDAAARGFRFYSSGVYDEPSCSPKEEDLDHSVALVGYGTDEVSGKDYWLVRNSW